MVAVHHDDPFFHLCWVDSREHLLSFLTCNLRTSFVCSPAGIRPVKLAAEGTFEGISFLPQLLDERTGDSTLQKLRIEY